jgi:hypothetical protein
MWGASLRRLSWQASQWNYRRHRARPFSGAARLRVLLLSEPNRISQSQVFPFHFYGKELFERWRHELREIQTSAFEKAPDRAPAGADVVLVQTWIDLDAARCDALFAAIRQRNPNAKIVFLDSFAPTDLRFASLLDRHVDLYVKKHVFRDRARYGQPTSGDTSVNHFYGPHYGLDLPTHRFDIPEGFLNKLVVGPTFFTSPRMLPHFHGSARHRGVAPQIDVHARLAANGVEWYQRMRQHAIDTVDSLQGRTVLSRMGASERRYIREMRSSRICFSPFGYGEVCWRDYEAVLCGAMLIKPDMGHVETEPDIFVPYETYIPIAWDFSDLVEKVETYLARESDRRAIAQRAYDRLHRYASEGGFVHQSRRLFER